MNFTKTAVTALTALTLTSLTLTACDAKKGGVSKSMLTLNEAIIDVKKG